MKIYAICVLKNEEDIILYTIKNALRYADKIIVFDNGSTDNTWELITSIRNPKVIPFKKEDKPYSDGLRAEIFDEFKNELQDEDWWVIQDADEFFVHNPRHFISNQNGYFHHINGKKIDFSFDFNQIESIDFTEDFSKDLQYFKYYTPEAWSEPRAIKHRTSLKWNAEKIWPKYMGLVCDNAIWIKHFPLRSLTQIRKRWKTRMEVKEKGGQSFTHWETRNWQEYYSRKCLNIRKVSNEEEVFKFVPFANDYKQGTIKRYTKLLLHKFGILP